MPRSPALSPPAAPRVLSAGPLSLEFSPSVGDFRYLRSPALELVRRVYFVARDLNWLNVPQRLSRLKVRTEADGFVLTARGRSTGPGIDLSWQLAIEGTKDGTVTYSVAGRARQSSMVNRVGLCVHLPLQGFKEARYDLQTGGGQQRQLVLPATVAPQSPCTDIRVMRFALPQRHRLELRFSGEEFEIEDQRNWIDGSFKIYSRPLARGFPYAINAGETFAQSLTLRLLRPRPAARSARRPAQAKRVVVRLGKKLPHPAPALGVGLPRDFAPPAVAEAAALASLPLAHARADFADFGRGLGRRVRHAVTAAAHLGLPLEVAVCLGEKHAIREIATLARALRMAGARVARVLLFGPNGRCLDSRATFQAAQRAFGSTVAAGTDFNFAELNRGQSKLPAARAYTFAANPQVHGSDEQTMAECLEGLRDVLTSAQAYFPGAEIGVSRLTLRPQKNAVATQASPDDEEQRFDHRQFSPWCAAWTVGALGALQTGGAAWATLYETTGPGGLVTEGGLSPTYQVIADYVACGRTAPLGLTISAPLKIAGWAREGRLALANLTTSPVQVEVHGRTLRLAPHGYRCLSL